MSSADLATVVISCPNCNTRYQVPYGTIGAAGREVQCAQCGKPWHALADEPPPPPIDPDALFTPEDEAVLDQSFETEAKAAPVHRHTPVHHAPQHHPVGFHPAHDDEPGHGAGPMDPDHARTLEEIRAAIAPKPKKGPVNAIDAATLKKATRSFDRRQRQVRNKLPLARFRRTARLGAFVALLSLLVLSFSLRVDLVRWFPALAGLYASIGLPVNVVGLTFEDTKTLNGLRDGKMVMQITAKIRSVSGQPVAVPPVLVSLVNDTGVTVYEWTVVPKIDQMEPGEVMDFSTEVNTPPTGATKVRLSFARNGAQPAQVS